jgi:hypothetical protein
MKPLSLAARAALLLGVLAILIAGLALARPWFRDWGSTSEEQRRALPGDEIVPTARLHGTHALTIAAPAATVFAWLAQTGQDRGGFHSYELLEDLVGCEMTNLPWLDQRLQRWQLGDKLWMYPPHKLGGVGHAVLMALEPGRALAFGTRQIGTPMSRPVDGSWSFVVEPLSARSSRLLIRGRSAGGLPLVAAAFGWGFFEPAHFVMERRMMEVIKARAEGRPVSALGDTVQVLAWFAALALMVASALAVLRGREPLRRLASFAAAGALLFVLPFTQPTPWLGAPLVLAAVLFAFAPHRRLSRSRPAVARPGHPTPALS